MSLFCLNCLRSVVKCLRDKCVSSTAAAANPSSPPPCHTPKPQSLCSDHSGFPMFSSEIQRVLNQVNISHLLPESVPPLGHCHLCADNASHWEPLNSLRVWKRKRHIQHKKLGNYRQLGRMQEQWIIQWYIFWRKVFRSVATPRKPPEQIPVLPWLEGVWQLKNSRHRDISVKPCGNRPTGYIWFSLSEPLERWLTKLHRIKLKRPKFVCGTGQDFRRKGIGCGICCLYCIMHPITTLQMGGTLEENIYPNSCL